MIITAKEYKFKGYETTSLNINAILHNTKTIYNGFPRISVILSYEDYLP